MGHVQRTTGDGQITARASCEYRSAGIVAGDQRIDLIGPVEDAVAEIARSKVAVVPLLSGSGTRFKILEAWAAARPVVSTTLGAEGQGKDIVYHGVSPVYLIGLGAALTLPVQSATAAQSLPPARFGVGSAVNSSFRQLGAVLGISVLVAVTASIQPG